MTDSQTQAAQGGALLRKLMARRGMTTGDLAAAANVSRSSVRAWRGGLYVPTLKAAFQVAKIFGAEEGADLLTAWGLDDTAEGLAVVELKASGVSQQRPSAELVNGLLGDQQKAQALTYFGRPLTEEEEASARLLIDLIRLRRSLGWSLKGQPEE